MDEPTLPPPAEAPLRPGQLRVAVGFAVFGAAASVGVLALITVGGDLFRFIQVWAASAALAVVLPLLLERTLLGRAIDALGERDWLLERLVESERRLEESALLDPLTGLLNHRAFMERAGTELRRAQREGYRVAVVALDIDLFRRINDGWGHEAGDEAIRLVAQRLAGELRPADLCGRLGADRFALALVQTGGRDAEQVVGRLRQSVRSVAFRPTGEPITASAGVALFPYDAPDIGTLLAHAEAALVRAKQEGRDRTVAHSTFGSGALPSGG